MTNADKKTLEIADRLRDEDFEVYVAAMAGVVPRQWIIAIQHGMDSAFIRVENPENDPTIQILDSQGRSLEMMCYEAADEAYSTKVARQLSYQDFVQERFKSIRGALEGHMHERWPWSEDSEQ